MPSSRHVGRVLRHVLSLSLAPLVGACAGIDTEGFEPIACENNRPQFLPGLAHEAPADYLEIRLSDAGGSGSAQTVETFGTMCATAADKAACEAKVAAATSTNGFRLGECIDFCPKHILIATAGDDVTIIDTEADIKSFVLPVDAPADAVLLASVAGYGIACDNPERGGVREGVNGYEVLATRYSSICDPIERMRYVLAVDADGNLKTVASELFSSESGCVGRRPGGLVRRPGRGATRAGAYFSQIAHLEAASVHAFEALRRELVHHGAPQSLIDRAVAARRDEVRHARVMRRVAQRYGGVARAPRVEHRPPRSLEEIAIENAVEGCVRETFGALIGMWQARSSRDPALRRVMDRIARDETRHASLAWAVDEWIRPRLSPEARQKLVEAQARALEEIAEEAREGCDPELVAWAGLPDAESAERLARNFAEAITAHQASA